jgi:hypothetical protein
MGAGMLRKLREGVVLCVGRPTQKCQNEEVKDKVGDAQTTRKMKPWLFPRSTST